MKELLKIDIDKVEEILKNIASFDRLSGSDGELKSIEYIRRELNSYNIETKLGFYQSFISNPISSRISYEYDGEIKSVKSKTRSFSHSTDNKEVTGSLKYISEDLFPKSVYEYDLNFSKDEEWKDLIILSESENPLSVLYAQNKGAIGFIQIWRGKEDLIHEGTVNPLWGAPRADQLRFFSKIPFLAINSKDGKKLIELCDKKIPIKISTNLDYGVKNIPILEAFIEAKKDTDKYILLGGHLDSWYKGATDSATGDSIIVYLLEYFNKIKADLNFNIKASFWSGHSNGRYAGSSMYARENYDSLYNDCIAYINIDMPGLKGANNYKNASSGPELQKLAYEVIKETTDQEAVFQSPIRGWDQSFSNIGVPSYFVWASTLPDGDENLTGKSFMSWWWHTEKDEIEFYQKEVLKKDVEIYMNAINKLSSNLDSAFDTDFLIDKLIENYDKFYRTFEIDDIKRIVKSLESLKVKLQRSEFQDKLIAIKILNQIYNSEFSSYLQDYSIQIGELPGLKVSFELLLKTEDEFKKFVIKNQIKQQLNRAHEKLLIIEKFLK